MPRHNHLNDSQSTIAEQQNSYSWIRYLTTILGIAATVALILLYPAQLILIPALITNLGFFSFMAVSTLILPALVMLCVEDNDILLPRIAALELGVVGFFVGGLISAFAPSTTLFTLSILSTSLLLAATGGLISYFIGSGIATVLESLTTKNEVVLDADERTDDSVTLSNTEENKLVAAPPVSPKNTHAAINEQLQQSQTSTNETEGDIVNKETEVNTANDAVSKDPSPIKIGFNNLTPIKIGALNKNVLNTSPMHQYSALKAQQQKTTAPNQATDTRQNKI